MSDPAAAAWAAGAQGERRVAARLSELRESWTVLHDRLLSPGRSQANLDHVVIGPGGAFLIDAKNRAGHVFESDGQLLQEKVHGGTTVRVNLLTELTKVHGMAAYVAVETDTPVTPVLCLAGSQEATFGEPRMLRGIWVVPVSRLVAWLESRPPILSRDDAERVVAGAVGAFPSATAETQKVSDMGRSATRKPRMYRSPVLDQQTALQRPTGPIKRPTRGTTKPSRSRVWSALIRLLVGFVILAVGLPFVFATVTRFWASRVTEMQTSPSGTAAAAPDCSRVSRGQIAKLVGRTVEPIAVRDGCSWGTRLDDPSTGLVTVVARDRHASYDLQLTASAKEHRVVFGRTVDGSYRPATALWVAAQQPIRAGVATVRARADINVVVSSTSLKISDESARRIAEGIAVAVNAAG